MLSMWVNLGSDRTSNKSSAPSLLLTQEIARKKAFRKPFPSQVSVSGSEKCAVCGGKSHESRLPFPQASNCWNSNAHSIYAKASQKKYTAFFLTKLRERPIPWNIHSRWALRDSERWDSMTNLSFRVNIWYFSPWNFFFISLTWLKDNYETVSPRKFKEEWPSVLFALFFHEILPFRFIFYSFRRLECEAVWKGWNTFIKQLHLTSEWACSFLGSVLNWSIQMSETQNQSYSIRNV